MTCYEIINEHVILSGAKRNEESRSFRMNENMRFFASLRMTILLIIQFLFCIFIIILMRRIEVFELLEI